MCACFIITQITRICFALQFIWQMNLVLVTNFYFLIPYNLTIRFPPYIFQTINSIRSNSPSLKYQRFSPSGCKDKGVRKYKYVAKTQFLYRTTETNVFACLRYL